MQNHEKMSDTLRMFIQRARCSGCRYCVQMDKTRKKLPLFIEVGDVNCCPVFAFPYAFSNIGDDLWFAGIIRELMDFIDELFNDRRVN
jgi:hypothetical protein